ncbi:hypothetical protein JAAARDRAFT_202983 [Jaapia argillacea MUCL 33604]|uniref:Uncharacterized protein n=1 Tax=Jaapia argillacea MUCL 33604 TaxID=933084 RepID=A0A067QJ67_9AGAM|nr:hypothetical protein JAAARDRAFT_202983 [Jaapia argillacea MUCL 33604]
MPPRFVAPLPASVARRQDEITGSSSSLSTRFVAPLPEVPPRNGQEVTPGSSPQSKALKPPPHHPSRSVPIPPLSPIPTSPPASSQTSFSVSPPRPLPERNATNGSLISDKPEEELSEEQLRELYDDEEIERFLHIFSTYVTEVRLPETPRSLVGTEDGVTAVPLPTEHDVVIDVQAGSEDGDWVPVSDSPTPPSGPPTPLPPGRCFSEQIAFNYIVPALPPPRPPPPPFTLARLRLTTQRLYLAVEPAYLPFFIGLWHLASWTDRRASGTYCAIFWFLWLNNLLLPALLMRILYVLIRNKLQPYPGLDELRRRRKEVDRAQAFGKDMQQRFSVASAFGVGEVWQMAKLLTKYKRKSTKFAEATNDSELPADELAPEVGITEKAAGILEEVATTTEGTTVLDDTKDSKEVQDIKRTILFALHEIADMHERVRNIFLWRRPSVSRRYAIIFGALFAVTLLVPAAYLAKLVYAAGGITFWHLTPIIAAIPPADRARFGAAFGDAPTDAEYAMDLISQRVAHGQDVIPTRHKKSKSKSGSTTPMPDFAQEGTATQQPRGEEGSNSINWKKLGTRVAAGTNLFHTGKKILSGQDWSRLDTWSPQNPGLSGAPFAPNQSTQIETHTFPAQNTKAFGVITLTPTSLFFTPLGYANPSTTLSLKDISGVKKSGPFKGLKIRLVDTSKDPNGEAREDKYLWVGERDELFARLIGWEGRQWIRV